MMRKKDCTFNFNIDKKITYSLKHVGFLLLELLRFMYIQIIVNNIIYFLTIHFGHHGFILGDLILILRPITSNFLINDGIVRIETEMKRVLNMDGVLEVSRKIYFDLQTLKIT